MPGLSVLDNSLRINSMFEYATAAGASLQYDAAGPSLVSTCTSESELDACMKRSQLGRKAALQLPDVAVGQQSLLLPGRGKLRNGNGPAN
jgi:hypothetical protein